MDPLLVKAARGERTPRPPVWLMRQAGRHLPEYREIREDTTFLEAIKTPALAEEITLLPWEYYEPDGLVVFSDILTVLEPLGFSYHIESGVGPVVEDPVDGPDDVDRSHDDVTSELDYVGDLVARVRETTADLRTADCNRPAVVGFAGGPFTLASYATAGGSSRNHLPLRTFRARHPGPFRELLESFADVVRDYLEFQIASGADVVQLFDTYAGILPPADYAEFVRPLHREILADLSAPGIVFVRHMGGRLDQLADAGADVIGLDWTVDMAEARERLGGTPVQGNLDPAALYADPEVVRSRTRDLIAAAGERGHILNLGHGVHADTPVEGVRAFVETAKETSR
ncbi:MAG: uroporphyrinogen decarboxylase [Haloarculaceae archaeon]